MNSSRYGYFIVLTAAFFFLGCDPGGPRDGLDDELSELILTNSQGGGHSFFLLPSSDNLFAIPQDPKNPLTVEKVLLGQMLFHETALAVVPKEDRSELTYSCASCHHSRSGFQAGMRQGIGEGGIGFGSRGETRRPDPDYLESFLDVQPIRSPSVLHTAYQDVMLWNGQFGAHGANAGTESAWTAGTPKETNFLGFDGVETQAIAGLTVHRMDIETSSIPGLDEYRTLFAVTYPEIPEGQRFTKELAGLAIAAYERTLLANQAPFQRWLRGNYSAMTAREKRGAIVFFGKGECATCHTGPALNDDTFHSLGMNDLTGAEIMGPLDEATKKGRGGFTGQPVDDYKFKTPQLYNLLDHRFFGHGASFLSVREVVEYKNIATPENLNVPQEQLDPLFRPLSLTDQEIDDLVAFLETGLYDPDLDRYSPSSIPSHQCFPVNDAQSKLDLGCN